MQTGDLVGRYRVLSKIGEGGVGVVYRARDEVLNRDVALKVLADSPAIEALGTDHLLQEARAGSALNHPNICTIHEVLELEGELCIAMELIEGRTFADLLAPAGLPFDAVLRYGAQIAGALAHAHGRGVIHHDLKSSNIVVTPDGLVKVLDFGLARRVPSDIPGDPTMTYSGGSGSGGVSGTLGYMAPEVLRGEPGDIRTDLWALGVVLYEASTGRQPFRGRTPFEISSSILNEPPEPFPPNVPPGLWAVVQRCLAKEPASRYQRAGEVKAALEALESGAIIGAREPSRPSGYATTVVRGIDHLRVRSGDVLLLIGTVKGAFLLRSNSRRGRWDVAGPYFHGHSVYSMAYDGRAGRHRLWAATNNYWGTFLRSSDDFGRTWTTPLEATVKFPADCGVSLHNIWQIGLSPHDPDVMYCGVEPAALFESRDCGATWALVRGLFEHPHRPRWTPGNGGLTLHSIVPDPSDPGRIYTAISAGGVYRTDDGGSTWQACNKGIRVVFQPEKYPEFGQCVHKIVLHPARPERLFLQNHWGLYRSDDRGETWRDIAAGVPSDFGFAMAAHPRDPDTVFILPIESDEFRCTPEGKLRVYRTRNAGASWEPLTRGLPQKGAFETVLRDGMAADALAPAGIYFGTRSGQVFGSNDEGKSWKRLVGGLPAIVCVKAAWIDPPQGGARRRPAARKTRAPHAVARRQPRRSARKR